MKKSYGFTLIEMIVAVFVFMILFLIAASFVNLASGSTKSNRTKMLTNDIRGAFDIINQKMNGANGKALIGSSAVYGFQVHNDVLGIVNSDGTNFHCTFIGQAGNRIYMKVIDPSTADCGSWPTLTTTDQPLTGTNISIPTSNGLVLPTILPNNSINGAKPATISPYIKISITAQDTDPKYKDDNKIDLQTEYTMDYQTIMRLKAQ